MLKPLSVFIGLRYVRSRHSKGFSSFISASSTIGIAIGVMVLIVVLSAMNGFERALATHLLSIVPHAEVVAVNSPITQWPKSVARIEQNPHVIAAAPFVKTQGMMQKSAALKGVEIRGVDVMLEPQVSAISRYMIAGKWQDLILENGVIIGAGIARKLSVQVGDKVQLLLPPANLNNQKDSKKQQFPVPMTQQAIIVGVFKFGGTIDDTQVFINLAKASELLGYQADEVQGIRLKVDDVFAAPQIVREVAYDFDFYVYMLDWTRSHGHLFNDIQLVRLVMFIVLVLVIAVASFNIVSTLIMAVNEKKSDIAILKTMGAKSSTIMASFMFQGLMNGIVGCLLGASLGILISLNLTDIIRAIEAALSVEFLSSEVYFIDFLPTLLRQQDVINTVITALMMSLLATIYPAWRATKVEPAQVLGQA
ncbi:lipoprotein-releasing ABC transporter permease subunit LolE [Colwellia sp. MB02u-18]|uniref:lipoprotein-releasing ABC transporter permease subunit LolE n=1 Tax=unclassified Colwellia TaxID=196834 RepID=UPI0015F42D65|nr:MULTISPECIES: lipoprotein-releasing ABC transporter permease subunit LolE [unclassified Colwellia]MBA6224239.1 lipoprotein-releasing ABC transporter permease subunit LolE [Colwellia sp. MB3u-45]MBA6268368.1 lipoprotein-releasing ABC transporter permease subunit LolE [Colwellia sp. MB3u-43]MBA6322679.1 lipoprotein-releasing ABC transporter permease subunit LolE [Colwellia sp. MB02u-19]MBA6323570.1 lipoprotein-releasing ABC transporter permease subunit LolE [Colwellia sp. MB02u-18]MBA6332822.